MPSEQSHDILTGRSQDNRGHKDQTAKLEQAHQPKLNQLNASALYVSPESLGMAGFRHLHKAAFSQIA